VPKCTICISPFREEIDKQLASGISVRNVAKQFKVGASSVHRHKADGHICKVIEDAAIESKTRAGLNIQKCAQEIYDLCFTTAQDVRKTDPRCIGSLLVPAVKVLEILNKGNDDTGKGKSAIIKFIELEKSKG
jgi:hypothetical protein